MQNQNFSGNTKRACKCSWSRRGSQKSFTLTIPWILAKPVNTFPGIIARQHLTNRKQMGLRERCAELRKGHLRYCCNQVWMTTGGRIPWSVCALCETCKISCLLANTLRTAIWRTIQRTNNSVWFDGGISPHFCNRPVATAYVRPESYANISLGYALHEGGIWK